MTQNRIDRVTVAREAFAGPFNCAQAVAVAFQDLSGLSAEQIESHRLNGGGRAPGGVCGALHAGLELVPDAALRKSVSDEFAALVGSTQCREIRGAKKTSCAECVATSATILTKAVDPDATGGCAPEL